MTRKLHIRPTGAAVVVGAMIGAVALAGCGAGQITQTSRQVSAVGGASANAGPIAVRDAMIEFAEDAEGATLYPVGGAAPLRMTIVNPGPQPDRLVSASSPAAASVKITGTSDIPPGQVVVVEGTPPATPTPTIAPPPTSAPGAAPTASAAPTTPPATTTAPAAATATRNTTPFDQGTQVVLTGLREDVQAGLTYPVVLTFERAGNVEMDVPVANSTEPREDESGH